MSKVSDLFSHAAADSYKDGRGMCVNIDQLLKAASDDGYDVVKAKSRPEEFLLITAEAMRKKVNENLLIYARPNHLDIVVKYVGKRS